jgi:hypothetical protein
MALQSPNSKLMAMKDLKRARWISHVKNTNGLVYTACDHHVFMVLVPVHRDYFVLMGLDALYWGITTSKIMDMQHSIPRNRCKTQGL